MSAATTTDPKTPTPTPTSAFQAIGKIFSDATSKKTPEGYMHVLDDLFADAAMDPEVSMVLVCRKGRGPVSLIGVKDGKALEGDSNFADVLEPAYFALRPAH